MRRLFSALALFPGLWLLVLAACQPSTEADLFTTILAFLGIGVVATVMGYFSLLLYVRPCPICGARVLSIFSTRAACKKCAPRRTTILRIAGTVAVCVLLPVIVVLGTYWRFSATLNDSDPNDGVSDVGWNKNDCWTDDISSSLNGKGEVAAARDSICDLGFGLDNKAFYVFVRKVGDKNDRGHLVLRFYASLYDPPPPVVEWVTPARVRIAFAEADAAVTKRVTQLNGIAIEFAPQPYAAFLVGRHGFYVNPPISSDANMSFDLLPLPTRAPSRPFKAIGEYSVFGCDGELLGIARPTLDAAEHLREHLEIVRHATGIYPETVEQIAVRGVRILYHRFADSYALELRFPDLQPGYKDPTEQYYGPAEGFVSCTTVHSAVTKEATLKAGGFVTSKDDGSPILFTPRFGIYTYKT